MTEISFESTPRLNDYLGLQYRTMLRSGGTKLLIGLALFSFGVGILAATGGTNPLGAFILPGIVVLNFALSYHNMKRAYNNTPTLKEPRVYSISTAGIDLRGTTFSSHVDWTGIRDVTETREAFLLFFGPHQALVLPKRDVGGQAEALRNLISTKIPGGKRFR